MSDGAEIDEELREWFASYNSEAVLFTGYESAIIGIAERCSCEALVVYDAERCVDILMQRDGMSEEDARDFFAFNTLGCWAGPGTPLFLWKFEK